MDPHRLTLLSTLHPQALVKEGRLLRLIEIFLELRLTPNELATCRRLGLPHRKLGNRVSLYNPLESLSWLMARGKSLDSFDTTKEAA